MKRYQLFSGKTVAAEIGNCMNDMPLALGNVISEFESMDLITPNRRNNNRSPDGVLNDSNEPDHFLKANQRIFNVWFESWLTCHIPKLMYQPKWFQNTHHIKERDIVRFLKQDSNLLSKYQYEMVKSMVIDRNGLIQKVNVR